MIHDRFDGLQDVMFTSSRISNTLGRWSLGEFAMFVNAAYCWMKTYSYGPLPVISTYNPIYRMFNSIYNQW